MRIIGFNNKEIIMSKFKVDRDFLKGIASSLDELIENMESDKEAMLDKDTDLLERYMSFSRISNILFTGKTMSVMSKNAFRLGFDMGRHDVFHTKAFKKCGWKDVDLNTNPFFKDVEEEGEED